MQIYYPYYLWDGKIYYNFKAIIVPIFLDILTDNILNTKINKHLML